MKRYTVKLFCFAAIQALIMLFVVLYRPISKSAYLRVLPAKYRMATQGTEPKMFFVGGSGVVLGLDCSEVAGALPYRPVNLAVHARLGMPFMLNQALDVIRKGDVVVICMEYTHYVKRFEADRHILESVVYYDRHTWRYVEPNDVKGLLDNSFAFLRTSLKAMVLSLLGESVEPEYAYNNSGLNEYGDMTNHWSIPSKTDIVLRDIRNRSRSIRYKRPELKDAIRRLNRFSEEVKSKGGTALLLFPSIPIPLYESVTDSIDLIERDLREQLTFRVLGRPEDTVYPVDCFFDTVYHLNRQGIDKRMRYVVEELKKALVE